MTTIRLTDLAKLLSCNNRTIWRIYKEDYHATWHERMNPEIDLEKFAALVNCDLKIFADCIMGKDRFLPAYEASRYVKTNTTMAFYARRYPPVLSWKKNFHRWTQASLRKSHERKYGK